MNKTRKERREFLGYCVDLGVKESTAYAWWRNRHRIPVDMAIKIESISNGKLSAIRLLSIPITKSMNDLAVQALKSLDRSHADVFLLAATIIFFKRNSPKLYRLVMRKCYRSTIGPKVIKIIRNSNN